MTTLYLPTLSRKNATQCSFTLQHNTQTFESPLNKTTQTYELPGARWLFAATWENLKAIDARIFKAWLAQMRGQAGRFYAGDLSHKTPSGYATGTGIAHAVASAGATAISSEWSAYNQANWLLPGDYFSINGELKIITVTATTNALGLSLLTFEPALRSAVAISDVITIVNPMATFKLNDDKQDAASIDPDRHPSITISATEVFQ